MRVGSLRVPFILQEQASGGGGAWSNVAVFWGSIKAEKVGDAASHVAVVRAGEAGGVETGMRLAWEERNFLIVGVERIDEGPWWVRVFLREEKALGVG